MKSDNIRNCDPSEHDWGEWLKPAPGARVRQCVKPRCQTTQEMRVVRGYQPALDSG